MKTKQILLVSTLVLLASCSNSDSFENLLQVGNMPQSETKLNSQENIDHIERAAEFSLETNDATKIMLGTWIGVMNGKKLTVVINKVNGQSLSGFNILGTTKRPLKGRFQIGSWDQPCAKAYDVTLNEPGDAKWDGVFTIKFVGYRNENESDQGFECEGPYFGSEATGSWEANNGKVAHDFSLVKQ
jgi:hypothetical protein